MEKKLIELSLQRGRLQERIAAQRATLAVQLRPLADALQTADRGLAAARRGVDYVKRHPGQVGVAVALLALLRPKGVWRWGRRAFVAWRLWKTARSKLAAAGIAVSRPAA
ncbi:YqjK-like family protein [Azospira restricta]|uniref:YqjK-like family protein n=1 Tax=Azospira restricta TaxID=404405 RepID=A0A974Y4F4_9RHOO|nr:YqjK-like family protein [Azospira restricta]QRJ64473.1 YqjK-like family protein [Azospira restricta]